MGAAIGGGGKSGGGGAPPLAVSPEETAALIRNMYQDAGMGGLGWTAGSNAGGLGVPTPTGSPTPATQFDLAQAAAGSAQQQTNVNNAFNLANLSSSNALAQAAGQQSTNPGGGTVPGGTPLPGNAPGTGPTGTG